MKLALCFLVYDRIEYEKLWVSWIGENTNVNIYIHSKYEFLYDSNIKFTQIPTVDTAWGGIGIVNATIKLFEKAIEDNCDRMILLSQNCIPVKKLSYVMNFFENDSRSFINRCFDDPNNINSTTNRFPRFNNLLKYMPAEQIIKHTQWIILNKEHTHKLLDSSEKILSWLEGIHCPDEIWALPFLHNENICMDIQTTYIDWSKKGSHPKLFSELSVEELQKILLGPSLFARKFDNNTVLCKTNIYLEDILIQQLAS
jgi:hypothetical protein